MAASSSSSTPPPDNTKSTSICQVCGDNASVINYGALTCPSCRTFFRRNGFPTTKQIPPCRLNGQCEVTKLRRRQCTACRLAKCLAVGMSPDFIRKEDLSEPKRKSNSQISVESQPEMTVPQVTTLVVPSDDSYLTASEWIIINNVVHAFDTYSPVTDIRRNIESMTDSASNIQFDLSQTLQMLSSFSNCLQLFICSTPDFKNITTDEQKALLKRNILGLLSIGEIYLMRECGIFDKPENETLILPLYEYEVIQQFKIYSNQLDSDSTLIKLSLLALAFTANCFIQPEQGHIDRHSLLVGIDGLSESQNIYIGLLWKYLINQYTYNQAVQKFSILIKQFLDIFKLSLDIYEKNNIFKNFIDNIIEQIEQSPMINDKTIIPLWGKS